MLGARLGQFDQAAKHETRRVIHLRPMACAIALLLVLSALMAAGPPSASAAVMSVTIEGPGGAAGRVVSEPPGIDCSNAPGTSHTACSFDFAFGSTPSLTATPDAQSAFSGWAGTAGGTCDSGATNPCTSGMVIVTPLAVTATFKLKPEVPIVTTGAVSGVIFPSAVLSGTVNPNSADFTVEDCYFEYGRSTNYGQTVPCDTPIPGTGTSDVSVSADTGLLEPVAVYHFRLIASNAGGTTHSRDMSFTSAPAPAESCPNSPIRAEQGVAALVLPDCMAFEMVSPPGKWQQGADTPSISSTGDRVLFNSRAALGDTGGPLGPLAADQYLASRTEAGWVTKATSPPASLRFGTNETGHPDSFTPDFGTWISLQGTDYQRLNSLLTVYQASIDGDWTPRSELLRPLNHVDGQSPLENAHFQAVSADGSHLFLEPGQQGPGDDEPAGPTYLPEDPEIVPLGSGGGGLGTNVYVIRTNVESEFVTELLSRDRAGKVWGGTCGAWVGGGEQGILGGRNQGAVSPDGRSSYFSTRPAQAQPSSADHALPLCDLSLPVRILKREETPAGPAISEVLPPSPAMGSDFFEGASVDGSKVFFTTSRSLAASDGDSGGDCSKSAAVTGCDLYLYDLDPPPGQPDLVQVSAGGTGGPSPGLGAKVYRGVVAISGDGSRVYFVAEGVLTAATNPVGRSAIAGQPNLYLYERDAANPTGRTTFLGTLSSADRGAGGTFGADKSFYGSAFAVPMTGTDRDGQPGGGSGRILVFRSNASLTGEDADGGHTDLYRYDSTGEGSLRCISCRPGGPDAEPFDVSVPTNPNGGRPVGQDWAERLRWVSEDGQTIAFSTEQALVSTDVDASVTSYIWRSGELAWLPISSREEVEGASVILPTTTVSRDGSEVAFQTSDPLVPTDGDTALDIYVARANGGFAIEEAPSSCNLKADECQGEGAVSPSAPNIGSVSFGQDGNVSQGSRRTYPVIRVKWRKPVLGTVARLRVRVPEAGRISMTGPRVRRRVKRVSKGGTYPLKVALRAGAKRSLAKRKRLRLDIRIAYRTSDGRLTSQKIKIILVRPKMPRTKVKKGER